MVGGDLVRIGYGAYKNARSGISELEGEASTQVWYKSEGLAAILMLLRPLITKAAPRSIAK